MPSSAHRNMKSTSTTQRLSTLLELRLMDLQVSVREARRARRVVHLLREEEPWFGY